MRVLLTFSGKHGDIIWSLQAARALALTGAEIDYGVMPQYAAVCPLVEKQPYINHAFPLAGWVQQHDWCGAQPRIPPVVPGGYDEIHHLTYESRPTGPLIMSALERLGLPMPEPAIPFLFAPAAADPLLVSYAFNGQYRREKQGMLNFVRATIPQARFENVGAFPFDVAATRIQASRFFFGCRSANYVVAMGLGKRCLTYELAEDRKDPIFGWPLAREHRPNPTFHHQFAELAKQWMDTPCD
jgi:hypothetical protein